MSPSDTLHSSPCTRQSAIHDMLCCVAALAIPGALCISGALCRSGALCISGALLSPGPCHCANSHCLLIRIACSSTLSADSHCLLIYTVLLHCMLIHTVC